jgi:hypothetical protein
MDPESELLPLGAVRLLTSGFDLDEADVTADVRQIATWSGTNDDLLVDIATRYQWPAKTAARYVRNLLFVLGRKPRHWGPP